MNNMQGKKHSPGFEWAYRDFLWTMMIIFMSLAVLATIVVVKKKSDDSNKLTASLTVEMQWHTGSRKDMDLWVLSPGDKPVGYSRKQGKYCNLVRDDLGTINDKYSKADEMTVCLAARPGEYIVNAVVYKSNSEPFPEPVKIIVRLLDSKAKDPDAWKIVTTQDYAFKNDGEQHTMVRFTLTEDGTVDPNSINTLQHDFATSTSTSVEEAPR